MLGQFARDRRFARARARRPNRSRSPRARRANSKNTECSGMVESSAMRRAPRGAFGRQKSFKKETVGGQARHHQSGKNGGGARHRHHLDILRQGIATSLKPGSEISGVPASETKASSSPSFSRASRMRPHDRGIMLVIGDQRGRDPIMGEQSLGDARILGDDRVGRRQRRQGAQSEISPRLPIGVATTCSPGGMGSASAPQAEGDEICEALPARSRAAGSAENAPWRAPRVR